MAIDFDGEKYRSAATFQHEIGQRIIAELPLEGNESILDLGSGDGSLTERLAARVPKGSVVGIDSSPAMIDSARQYESSNLQFQLQDINEMQLEGHFDIIYSNATLHWIQDHHRVLHQCYEALNENGFFRWNFGSAGNCPRLYESIQNSMDNPRFKRFFTKESWPWFLYSIDEYREFLAPYAFRDLQLWEDRIEYVFHDAAALISWVEMPCLIPFLKLLPKKEQQPFHDAVIQHMVEICAQSDGTFMELFVRLNVFARK
jgi:trans-aconitate methyltransferase